MNRRLFNIFIGLTLVFMASCSGTDVGNPAAPAEFDFAGLDTATQGALTLSTGLVIDEAWLALDGLRFWRLDDAGACEGDGRIDLDGPFAIELISGQELPNKPSFTPEEGSEFCRVDLNFNAKLADTLPENAPAALGEAAGWSR